MLNNKNEMKALTLLTVAALPDGAHLDALMSALYETNCAALTDLADVFEELTAEELITLSIAPDGAKQCTVSAKGASILPELSALLADGVRIEATRAVLRAYERLTGGTTYGSRTETANGGTYLVCYAQKNGKETAALRLYFDSEKDARAAKHNFEKRPQTVINALTALLTGDAGLLL